jgi:C4-dicarboxylate-specific signal transduction histidine kinase
MTTEDMTFAARYRGALTRYVDQQNQEAELMVAFELGRLALTEGYSLLDVLGIHHAALWALIEHSPSREDDRQRLGAANDFLIQVAAPFEMAHRGWHDMAERLRSANEELEKRVADRTAAHRKAEEHLDRAQQIAGIGSWEFDLESGLHLWSREMYRILNRPAGSAPPDPNSLVGCVHDDDRQRYDRWMGQLLAGRNPEPIEIRMRRPDGECRIVSASGEVILAANGTVKKVGGTLQDISRRKAAEAQLRELQAELAHISRLSTVGHMTSALVHEINQPLAAIVASANAGLRWLAHQTPAIDEVNANLKQIHGAAHRASEVVKSIRSIFTKDSHESTLLNFNNLISEVLTLVDGELKGRISIEPELFEDLPQVQGNRVQLQQVVLNLIMNAVEAMDAVKDRARILKITSQLHEPASVLIRVQDTGSGIDPKNINRIFEAFFTTKARGTGMGLSICRSIIEAHGGRLWASAAVPCGSIFHIELPRAETQMVRQ